MYIYIHKKYHYIIYVYRAAYFPPLFPPSVSDVRPTAASPPRVTIGWNGFFFHLKCTYTCLHIQHSTHTFIHILYWPCRVRRIMDSGTIHTHTPNNTKQKNRVRILVVIIIGTIVTFHWHAFCSKPRENYSPHSRRRPLGTIILYAFRHCIYDIILLCSDGEIIVSIREGVQIAATIPMQIFREIRRNRDRYNVIVKSRSDAVIKYCCYYIIIMWLRKFSKIVSEPSPNARRDTIRIAAISVAVAVCF